ncbi:MAG: DUF3450 domain-containing protein [Myxococcota bacterium]|nr:DUF3450 domain-containing protein [Myxococcota bacterium]
MRSCERRLGGGLATAISTLVAAAVVWPAAASSFDEAMDTRNSANTAGAASQKKIDELDNETDTLLTSYTNLLNQLDAVRVFNKQMTALVNEQEARRIQYLEEIDNVELVGRQITPHMLKMIDAIEKFVELDVPFLKSERTSRVAFLRDAMTKADVSDAEKYRAIMEAYQIENEFGRTIEAYVDTLEIDGVEREADFLRIGRVALVYMTPDGQFMGAWDQNTRSWVVLDRSYLDSIKEGLRMARKQAAPSLILVPVGAPENL